MFENLTERLQRTFKNLRGQGKLSDEHLDAALAEIREALLEGDVAVAVADELLANIPSTAIARSWFRRTSIGLPRANSSPRWPRRLAFPSGLPPARTNHWKS